MQNSKSMLAIVIISILAACSVAVPAGPVPRKAPELFFYDRSGKAISLSSFKGKVVALEFLFVRSMHCARVAQTLNKLNGDLRSRGFQSVGVAFSAPQSVADAATVDGFIQSLRLAYPVGYTDKENVDSFLDREKDEVLNIPQVVIIDRAGVIRAQSGVRPGDPKLEDENSLRVLLDALLKEAPPQKKVASAKAARRPWCTSSINISSVITRCFSWNKLLASRISGCLFHQRNEMQSSRRCLRSRESVLEVPISRDLANA